MTLTRRGLLKSAGGVGEIFFDDVRVPGSCLLGGKDTLDERLARARSA